ncbi:uncharacterized protein L3040_009534 [Drepanopeziza brunnea f. sp. 'multigermtubi']|uniref:Ribonuclease n=1 Tax=Marssonina brunnea f. sp. multigermtubi (strain MB_m1) TaxID=1072389 RepID=K1WT45_MARBU|nr:ribonuclease [Drepanopeziza brunnea f. sp. 'multigermtubi' MB_m1]EKD16226.1 ribonuclease [Drepanopeziza brunnea f. sp. 'multigermtubi' MB_m1]KAJ5032948.1 hypothetical protein L3040_009534 [Drepanopeziza brunnea f. sp. 'multigermtubi']
MPAQGAIEKLPKEGGNERDGARGPDEEGRGGDSDREGVFEALKTTLETRGKGRESSVRVFVTAVEARMASAALSLVRKLVPDDGGLDLQHLRRVAKLADLPSQVQVRLTAPSDMPAEERAKRTLFLICGPTTAISFPDLLIPLRDILGEAELFEVDVPLLAPTSQEQAEGWTRSFWPTVYKKSNPFGPHVSILARAEEEMKEEVGRYFDLAEKVAGDCRDRGLGERVGVCVVERKGGKGRVVAVAGDVRWMGWEKRVGCGNVCAHAVMRAIGMVAEGVKGRGDAEDGRHDVEIEGDGVAAAVLEKDLGTSAISTAAASVDKIEGAKGGTISAPSTVEGVHRLDPTIAATEAGHPEISGSADTQAGDISFTFSSNHTDRDQQQKQTRAPDHSLDELFQDTPLLPLEKQHYDPSGNQNGYLCHDLEIYCTHEPCVMCSMAIVHSRFGRVVFRRRMGETGGLCADGELGHGLFWRKELNWTLLAWQWKRGEEEDGAGDVEPHLHA